MSLYSTDPSFSSDGMLSTTSIPQPPHHTDMFMQALAGRSLFKRCISCSDSAPPCPSCDEGYACTMISRSCDQCATTKCVPTSTGSSSDSKDNSSDGGSNAGAIAGGVIGGIAFIGIVLFLIWWFVIRKKRQQYAEQGGNPAEKSQSGAPTDPRQARKSTQSIASTVLTRASNVIQIAYIPGVTNRSPPETPLVPPVPPLPGAAPDQHFFMPGDLRDSSWSDMTQERRSIAPSLRSSVATTIYRNNAIVSPMPAQQIMRTRAAVVSIHNGGNSPDSLAPPDAPAVPAITQAQLAKAGVSESNNSSSIVARTVTAKPVMVKGGVKKINNTNTTSTPAVQTIEEQPESGSSAAPSVQQQTPASGFDASSSDEEDAPQTKKPTAATDSNSRASTQSPFRDQPTQTNPRTSALLENHEGSRSNRSSRVPPPRVESPFSDANEVK